MPMRISNVTSVNGVCPYGNYRRGVLQRVKTMFAGRGISLPGLAVTAGVVVAAFGLPRGGVDHGWPARAASRGAHSQRIAELQRGTEPHDRAFVAASRTDSCLLYTSDAADE